MRTKMKGLLYKAGFKYIANIWFIKEREMEIGFPTDVKHVSHIGWNESDGAPPSWMNAYSQGEEFAVTSIQWISQDFSKSLEPKSESGNLEEEEDAPPSCDAVDAVSIPKGKPKRKKIKSNTSPKSATATRSSSRGRKSRPKFIDGDQTATKPKFIEGNYNATNIEVA